MNLSKEYYHGYVSYSSGLCPITNKKFKVTQIGRYIYDSYVTDPEDLLEVDEVVSEEKHYASQTTYTSNTSSHKNYSKLLDYFDWGIFNDLPSLN